MKSKNRNLNLRPRFENRQPMIGAKGRQLSLLLQDKRCIPFTPSVGKFFSLSAYRKPFPMSWRLEVTLSDGRWEIILQFTNMGPVGPMWHE